MTKSNEKRITIFNEIIIIMIFVKNTLISKEILEKKDNEINILFYSENS